LLLQQNGGNKMYRKENSCQRTIASGDGIGRLIGR